MSLLANTILASIEGLAYALTAGSIFRRGGDPMRRFFVAWWALAALGLASSATLLASGLGDEPSVAWVKANLAVTFVSAALGVAVLSVFIWYLLRGTLHGWIAAPVALAAAIAAAVLLAGAAATVVVGDWGVRLDYANGPPTMLFASQGILSLLALGLAVTLLVAAKDMDGVVKKRTRLVSAAVIVFYVGKAIAGASLTVGDPGLILVLTRAMGLGAAFLGFRAYLARAA